MIASPGLDEALFWTLASIRLLALFVSAPVFSHSAVPVRARLGLALLVAIALAPSDLRPAEGAATPLDLAGIAFGEALIGLSLGFAVRLLFAAFDLFGEFVSVQGGLGAATVLDPASGSSSLALATTFQAFAMLAFVLMDGHHALLRAAALSYERLPIGGGAPEAAAFLAVVGLGASIFEIAFRLAAPITVAMFVSNVGVGILGRAIPQLNLMMLQLPAHVAITLVLLMLGAGALLRAAADQLLLWTERSASAVLGGA